MKKNKGNDLKALFDSLVTKYETPDFIIHDPISVPHSFSQKQDIEIAGFFTAIFAWGQRKTIINKSNELMALMDHKPHDFILGHSAKDLKSLTNFKHRTFQYDDLLYFISWLNHHYSTHLSLESAFLIDDKLESLEKSLNHFSSYFFCLPHLRRTQKHVSNPMTGSTCKRLCMFLRWMVRSNERGVDFGIWKNIQPSDLMIPLDVHVHKMAVRYGFLKDHQRNWKAVTLLTDQLKEIDPSDPVKYDFALFNLSLYKGLE